MELRPGHGTREYAAIDDQREPLERTPGDAQGAGQRTGDVVLEHANAVVVVRVARGDDLLVLVLQWVALAVAAEAGAAVMEHEHVVREHVVQPAPDAAL